MTGPSADAKRQTKSPRPNVPPAEQVSTATAKGVRRQRKHIQDLTGEDPLRGGVAD